MRFLRYVIFALVLVSCYDIHSPDKPKDLISEGQMVSILVDMSLFNSAKGINKKILDDNGITSGEFIYKKHGIDSLQFANSNHYYTYHIEDYSFIYERVKDSLNRLKTTYKSKEDERKKKRRRDDSIRRQRNRDTSKLNRKAKKPEGANDLIPASKSRRPLSKN